MAELITRFLIGGMAVAAFAAIGDILKPKSFAGLFGAAPSVALASLALTIAHHGRAYAARECRSMVAGAVALGVYSATVCIVLLRRQTEPLPATLIPMIVWFGVSFGAWYLLLR